MIASHPLSTNTSQLRIKLTNKDGKGMYTYNRTRRWLQDRNRTCLPKCSCGSNCCLCLIAVLLMCLYRVGGGHTGGDGLCKDINNHEKAWMLWCYVHIQNENEFTFLASASTVKEARSFWFYVHAQKQRFTFLASNRQTHAANHH
jgi:hypothetical protein